MDEKRTPGPSKYLTPMQMKFATLLVYGIEGIPVSKTEAAKRAGYSDAANEGSKMTNPKKYPLVCAFISNLRDEVRQKYGISFESHLEELAKIRDMGKKDRRNLAAAATTEIARGKVGGYYIDQKLIRHGNIDDMNLSELYDKMRSIKEKNERLLKAKEALARSSEESESESKKTPVKLSLVSNKKPNPDSTS